MRKIVVLIVCVVVMLVSSHAFAGIFDISWDNIEKSSKALEDVLWDGKKYKWDTQLSEGDDGKQTDAASVPFMDFFKEIDKFDSIHTAIVRYVCNLHGMNREDFGNAMLAMSAYLNYYGTYDVLLRPFKTGSDEELVIPEQYFFISNKKGVYDHYEKIYHDKIHDTECVEAKYRRWIAEIQCANEGCDNGYFSFHNRIQNIVKTVEYNASSAELVVFLHESIMQDYVSYEWRNILMHWVACRAGWKNMEKRLGEMISRAESAGEKIISVREQEEIRKFSSQAKICMDALDVYVRRYVFDWPLIGYAELAEARIKANEGSIFQSNDEKRRMQQAAVAFARVTPFRIYLVGEDVRSMLSKIDSKFKDKLGKDGYEAIKKDAALEADWFKGVPLLTTEPRYKD